jgi:ABC-type uncharacterized transport system substrate-binding protein
VSNSGIEGSSPLRSTAFNRRRFLSGTAATVLAPYYGVDQNAVFRRTAEYVDKILRGAHPEDLPIEQPKQFVFAINLITARRLGLAIPPSLLQRADVIIR